MRRGRLLPWREAIVKTMGVMAIGAVWAGATLYYSPLFFLWLTPIFAGLLLAAPLVWWTSSAKAGRWTRRRGLFLVPSETSNPAELQLSTWSSIDPSRARVRKPKPLPGGLLLVPPEWPRAMPGRGSAHRRGAARADRVEVASSSWLELRRNPPRPATRPSPTPPRAGTCPGSRIRGSCTRRLARPPRACTSRPLSCFASGSTRG